MRSKALTILAFSLIAAPIFCKHRSSTLATGKEIKFFKRTTGKKVKIADTPTLEALFAKDDVNVVLLARMGIFENFSEKEVYKKNIEKRVDDTANAYWKDIVAQIEKLPSALSKKEFEEGKELMHEDFMDDYNEVKPAILKILRYSAN